MTLWLGRWKNYIHRRRQVSLLINLAVAFQKDVRGRIYEDCYRKIIWCQHYGSLTAFVWKKIGEFLYTINWKQNIKPLAVKILQKVERELGKTYSKSSSTQTHGLDG